MAESVSMDMSGDWAAALDRLADGVKEQVLRSGGNAASEVFQEEAKVRVRVKTGKLRQSIYRVFSEDSSGEAVKIYHVSWNARKAPHGHLLEFGTSRQAAHPFLRPAYGAAKARAAEAGIARMTVRMQELLAQMKT